MGHKHRSVPREAGESGEVRKLKDAIRRLKSDKNRLLAELKTLQEAFDKTRIFIDNKLDNVPVETVIAATRKEMKLKEITLDNEELKVKCEQCSRPYTVLVSTMIRTIYFCDTCKIKKNIYANALPIIDSIEAIDD